MVHTFLPKQTDLNKIIWLIGRKILKGTHLPMSIKEIHTGYLTIPYLKNINLYLMQTKLPSFKAAIRQVETQTEDIYYLTYYCLGYKISWWTGTSTMYTWMLWRPNSWPIPQLIICCTSGIFKNIFENQA